MALDPQHHQRSIGECFPLSYGEARKKFISALNGCGWSLASHPIAVKSPGGDTLTIDVGTSPSHSTKTLLLSSGLHGVEGYFGSAIQVTILQAIASGEMQIPADCRIVMTHALNPFGFACDRRANENNIDLNRNFLLSDAQYAGSPPGYGSLDPVINPVTPTGVDFFKLRFIWKIVTVGMPKLKAAIATGQYDFPKGLFFGGKSASETFEIVRRELPGWIPKDSRAAIALDFHSGLGGFGEHVLLTTKSEESIKSDPLAQAFDQSKVSCLDSSKVAFPARGVMTEWITHHQAAQRFLAFGVEFGTYSPLRVLSALRGENRSHFFDDHGSATYRASKAEMREVFCPTDVGWRTKVISESCALVRRALEVLSAS